MHAAQTCPTLTRVRLQVRGIVQGVGFRPFVYTLARRHSLKGLVLNNTTGVLVDVEGDGDAIEQFIEEIKTGAPPLALVESVERGEDLSPAHFEDFLIAESTHEGEKFVPVSADTATCADCLREMRDPADRRYRYPFINCTNCGPRFTIIVATPYDRARTTMRDFEMCGRVPLRIREPTRPPLPRRADCLLDLRPAPDADGRTRARSRVRRN